MALGRSNSLSLNTGAVNSTFAQQQQQGQQPAAATSNSLFGGSLFGNQNNSAKPTNNSLFGGQTGATTTSQPQSGGLFGAAQPAPSTGSLFGGSSSTQAAGSTSLFGGGQQPLPQSQPASSGNSLFGGSLFGSQAKTTETKPASTSLFGAQPTMQSSTNTGLFGAQSTAPSGGSLFGAKPAASVQNNNAAFSQAQSASGQPSLLSASRYSLGQAAPFTGRLSMGQGNATQTTTTPAAKLSWDTVRPTTRFTDLVDPAKEQLEAIDKMIQQQEAFCKQIEAFLPVHGTNLHSLEPDIKLVQEKIENAEQALITDAQGVQYSKNLTMADAKNVERCERIGENLRLPAQYHYAPAARGYGSSHAGNPANDKALDDEQDTDLVGNYFTPTTAEMKKMLESYQANLSEVENHLQTIEAGTIAHAQSLGRERSSSNGQDSTRQLADTLRGFEGTILSTAAKVGACRESVNALAFKNAKGAAAR